MYKIISSILILLTTLVCNNINAQSKSEEVKAIKTLNDFYKEYCFTFCGTMPTNPARLKLLRKKYFTKRLFMKFKNNIEMDSDPLMIVQDCELDWCNSLKIRKDKHKSNLYIVNFSDSSVVETIKLIVKKEKGEHKIYSIIGY